MEKKLDKELRNAIIKILSKLDSPREIVNLYFDGNNIVCMTIEADFEYSENIVHVANMLNIKESLEKETVELKNSVKKLKQEKVLLEKAIKLIRSKCI